MKTMIAIFISLIGLQATSQTTPLIQWGFDNNPGQQQHFLDMTNKARSVQS